MAPTRKRMNFPRRRHVAASVDSLDQSEVSSAEGRRFATAPPHGARVCMRLFIIVVVIAIVLLARIARPKLRLFDRRVVNATLAAIEKLIAVPTVANFHLLIVE